MHAFCGRLIRTYFYLLPEENLSPDFRILTPQDAAGLANKALSSALERAFEEGEETFRRVADAHYRGKRDKALRAVVAKTYDKVRGYENGEELLLRAGEDKFGGFFSRLRIYPQGGIVCGRSRKTERGTFCKQGRGKSLRGDRPRGQSD